MWSRVTWLLVDVNATMFGYGQSTKGIKKQTVFSHLKGLGGWGGGVSKSKRNFVGGVRASITKYYMGGLLKHNKIKT